MNYTIKKAQGNPFTYGVARKETPKDLSSLSPSTPRN